jgi:hypothetical protein
VALLVGAILACAAPARAGTAVPAFTTLSWAPSAATANDDFGRVVAPAGDVNRDGYGDILVTSALDDIAPDGDEGRVYLFLGTASGIAATPAWSWSAGTSNVGTGAGLASAGDVNGDGYADVAVGVPGWSITGAFACGKVAIFHGSASGLPAVPSLELFPPNAAQFDHFGTAVATAGDVNADGYADLIVGAPDANRNAIGQCGVAYVFHGGANGLAQVPSFTYAGPDPNGRVGAAVSTAGDVNGDGFADVLVGAPHGRLGGVASGEVNVFLGTPFGILAAGAVTLNALTLTGKYGTSVANAGDVDGDGYADILIGDPEYNDGFINGGRVELRRGAAGGINPTPLLVVESSDATERLGQGVATLGDLDGDGYADFGYTAPGNGSVEPAGRVVVYRGGPTTPEFVGELFFAPADSGQIGSSLATTGDLDGDGRAEILLGNGIASITPGGFAGRVRAYRLAPPTQQRAFAGWPRRTSLPNTFYGGSLAILPRFDLGGFPYLAVGEPNFESPTMGGRVQLHSGTRGGINVTPSLVFNLASPDQSFGDQVLDAGDVDGDGLSDLVIAAPQYVIPPLDLQRGRIGLVRGSSVGNFPVSPVITGTQPAGFFGGTLAGRGDVNGDGYQDVLVGEPGWNGVAGTRCGRVSLYFGAPGGFAALPWTLEGEAASQGLGFGAAMCDLDADGYSDLILGSPAIFGATNVGFLQVHYGGPAGPAAKAWTLQSSPPDLTFGNEIADVGDQNGDGVCDFAVSVNSEDVAGRLMLFAGGRGRSRPLWPFWTRTEPALNVGFGSAIAGGGDVNGDGRADFVVGSPSWAGGQVNEGRIQLYLGSAIEPQLAWTFESDRVGGLLGVAIAPLADVNGDGYADIIASAPGDTGRVYAFSGGNGPGVPRPLLLIGSGGVLGDPGRFHPARLQPGELAGYEFVLRSAEGRARLSVQTEKVLQHEPFVGGAPAPGAFVLDTGAPQPGIGSATDLLDNLDLPWEGAAFRVRARTRSASPFFPQSPWIRPEAHESGDHDLWNKGVQVAVDPPAAPSSGAHLSGVRPNPFHGGAGASTGARIAFELPRAAQVSLDVYDVRGARVRSLRDEFAPAGPGVAVWDGRDDRGRAMPAGLYFVGFAADGRTDRARVVLLP